MCVCVCVFHGIKMYIASNGIVRKRLYLTTEFTAKMNFLPYNSQTLQRKDYFLSLTLSTDINVKIQKNGSQKGSFVSEMNVRSSLL